MTEEIFIKKSNSDISKELASINFDSNYLPVAINKYDNNVFKIYNLRPHEGNILKQLCLSLGFDCAVSKETVMCKCEYTNALISANTAQINTLIKKLELQPFRLKILSGEFKKVITKNHLPYLINNREFNPDKTYIMGILNVTPDSFSDGGEYYTLEKATNKAMELIKDGADIIDIGGESTRPQAKTISVEEEIKRVIPVIENVRKLNKNIPISVDTRNSKTADAALLVGANIINDVSALEYDEQMISVIKKYGANIVLMHSTEIPPIVHDNIDPTLLIETIYKYFYDKISFLDSFGILKDKIIIDPGFGFGKSVRNSFDLIKRIDEFQTLNVPILVGISKKSFIKKQFKISGLELEHATEVLDNYLVYKKINFIRVHDVKRHKTSINYLSELL